MVVSHNSRGAGCSFFRLGRFQVIPKPLPASFLWKIHCDNLRQTSFLYNGSGKTKEHSTNHCIIPSTSPVKFPSLVFGSPTTHNTHYSLRTVLHKSRLHAQVPQSDQKQEPCNGVACLRLPSLAFLWTLCSLPHAQLRTVQCAASLA